MLGFQGDLTDSSTGLFDLGTRFYAPTLGRFTTRDSVFGSPSSPMSLNQFTYGAGNPVSSIDPNGMCPNPAICPPPPGATHRYREMWLGLANEAAARGAASYYSNFYAYVMPAPPPPPPPGIRRLRRAHGSRTSEPRPKPRTKAVERSRDLCAKS